MSTLRFVVGGSTTIGVRPSRVNEDFFFFDSELGLVAVFDAAGSLVGTGERTGPVSAAIFQRALREEPGAELSDTIGRAFRLAGEAIREEIRRAEPEDPDCAWASVALAMVRGERAYVSWLGDVMTHRVAGNRIEPLTRPHTAWNECVRQGVTPTNERWRDIIMYSLGAPIPDSLEVVSFTPLPGDRLILTTDGVTDHIPDSTILTACRTISDPTTCAEAIIEHALMTGSRDNCTCAVIAFD